MRSLKFKLRRESLNQICISFLRPILEYASVVWDNCTVAEKDSLEKIQHEAAHIVTGTTRSITLNNLYNEIGWLSLADRRTYQNLFTLLILLTDWHQPIYVQFTQMPLAIVHITLFGMH